MSISIEARFLFSTFGDGCAPLDGSAGGGWPVTEDFRDEGSGGEDTWASFTDPKIKLKMYHYTKRGKNKGHECLILKNLNVLPVQWKLDLADTGLAENFSLKDTLQKLWETVFDF